MPGLVRGMARVAVVSGTATATRNAVNRRQASKNVEAYGDAQQEYTQKAAAPAPAVALDAGASPAMVVSPSSPESMDDKLAQLERLAQMHSQGILNDDEFAVQKNKILNS